MYETLLSGLEAEGAMKEEAEIIDAASCIDSLPFFKTLIIFPEPCLSTPVVLLLLLCATESPDTWFSIPSSVLGHAEVVAAGSVASETVTSSATSLAEMYGPRSPFELALSTCIPDTASQTDQSVLAGEASEKQLQRSEQL